MADWRLGKEEEARAALARGNALDPNVMPAAIADDPSNAWLAWLYARIQLDEAAALIQQGATDQTQPGGQLPTRFKIDFSVLSAIVAFLEQ